MVEFKIANNTVKEILQVDADGIITINNKRLDSCNIKELHNTIKEMIKSISGDTFKDVDLQ